MEDTYKLFLGDCLQILIERTIEAREKAASSNHEFDNGVAFGYTAAVNFLINQADVWQIKDSIKEKIKDWPEIEY